jgi:hypothetical protein
MTCDIPKPKAGPRKPKAATEPTPALGKRNSRSLLSAYAGLTRLEAMLKLGRKPAIAKAKTSQKTARSKKTELEWGALLRKADIQV